MTDSMTPTRWDGENLDGRPVANCQECGALRYAEDIEYIGEAALGGPNFTYRLGDLAAPALDVSDLAAFFHEEYWEAANEPHRAREDAESSDCEVCWRSADRLLARLSGEVEKAP